MHCSRVPAVTRMPPTCPPKGGNGFLLVQSADTLDAYMDLWGLVQAALERKPVGQERSFAVVSPPDSLSRRQLLNLAAIAADSLLQPVLDLGFPTAPTPKLCGIFLTNSAAYVVSVLAALRSGLAFLPLDPSWPAQRLQAVFDEAQPLAILWTAAGNPGGHGPPAVHGVRLIELPQLAALVAGGAAAKRDQGPGQVEQGGDGQQQHRHQQQRQQEAGGARPLQAAPGAASSCVVAHHDHDCCYVLYTSGSTGRPLGVLGTQRGVVNRCRWLEGAVALQEGDCVAFKTHPCFVDSVWEVFGPLLAGVPLLAVPQEVVRDPAKLLSMLAEHRVTHLAAVPTLWRALAASLAQHADLAARLRLRLVVSSGEPLPGPLLARMRQFLPAGCSIWNLYGCTELAADCTAFNCTTWSSKRSIAAAAAPQDWEGQQHRQQEDQQQQQEDQQQQQQQQQLSVPVGRPISNAFVAVLGADAADAGSSASRLRAVPAGAIGEVAVGGEVLAAGYLGQHPAARAAQARRFVALPAGCLPWPASQTGSAGGPLPSAPAAAVVGVQGSSVAAGSGAQLQGEAAGPGMRQHPASVPVFLTGDLGWLDEGGCLHLVGRRDLQAKISGVRVDLAEVAAVLDGHPGVQSAAAKLWHLPTGPVMEAYVELVPGDTAAAAPDSNGSGSGGVGIAPCSSGLKEWCQQRLPPAAVPGCVHVLAVLPRSSAGKVLRSELAPSPAVAAALEGSAAAELAVKLAAGAPAVSGGGGSAAPAGREDAAVPAFASGLPAAPVSPAKRQRVAAAAAEPAVGEGQQQQQQQQWRQEQEQRQQAAAAAPAAPPAEPAPPGSTTRPPSEVEVSAAFATALGHRHFEATTNLFAMGGTSLTAAEIAGCVAGGRIELVIQHPTVRSLAACLKGLAAKRPADTPVGSAAAAGDGQDAVQQAQQAQQLTAEQSGVVPFAHPLQIPSGGSAALVEPGGAAGGGPRLQLMWRAKMQQCVDASPLLHVGATPVVPVLPTYLQQQGRDPLEQQRQQQQQDAKQPAGPARVLACSHGGDVCCYELGTGQHLWQAQLPDRADAGLALCWAADPPAGVAQATAAAAAPDLSEQAAQSTTQRARQQGEEQLQAQSQQGADEGCAPQQRRQYIAAATNGGALFFLDAASGAFASLDTGGGGIRAAPTCDPWSGLVWQPTHGRQLVVVAALGREVARLALPAAVSAPVSFCAERRLAFVACLDGSLLAVQTEQAQQAQQASRPQQAGLGQQKQLHQQPQGGMCLRVAWQWRASAPLFAPAVVSGSAVLAAAVNGSITSLDSRDGGERWRVSMPGAVFAPPLVAELRGQQVLLVGTQEGQLAVLDADSGRQLALAGMGGRVTGIQLLPSGQPTGAVAGRGSAAGATEPTEHAAGAAQGRQQAGAEGQGSNRTQLVALTLGCGVLAVVDLTALLSPGSSGTKLSSGAGSVSAGELSTDAGSAAERDEQARSSGTGGGSASGMARPGWLVDAVRLPGDVFAAPAVAPAPGGGAYVAVGCRDDHLYVWCLQP